MENNIKKKINTAGTVGYIITIILIIGSIAMLVVSTLSTIAVSVLPTDDLRVSVASDIVIEAPKDFFEKAKSFVDLEGETEEEIVANDDEIDEFKFTETENGMTLNVKSNKSEYNAAKLIMALVSSVLYYAALTAMLYMVKALMKAFKTCDTPFSDNVVKRIKNFGFSMIPVIATSMLTEAFWDYFTSRGGFETFEISLDLKGILALAVVFVLALVFNYGAELQKLSDETL